MKKITIQKTIVGITVLGTIICGAFVINKNQPINQMRSSLVKKIEQNTLTYDEYLQLISEYNIEIEKVKKEGKKFKLKNIDKNNLIIDKLNDKLIK